MSQIHECYVSANMDATKNRSAAVFSVTAVHGLVQNAMSNHGQLIGTLHHHASVTTFVAAITRLDSFALGDCLQTDFSEACPFIRRLNVCVPEVHLSVHTLYLLTVSSELLRGLSSVLLA